MKLSRHAHKLLRPNAVGYRCDDISEGRFSPLEVVEYEILELGNIDILATLYESGILRLDVVPDYDNPEHVDYLYDQLINFLEQPQFINANTLWLCAFKKDVITNYIEYLGDVDDYEISTYRVPDDALVLSDLADQGVLLLSTQQFEEVEI